MDTDLLAQKLESWIKEQVLAGGRRGIVLGLSGGLDSATIAVLCQRAFPQNTLGVIMPCHSLQQDRAHAEELARKFSIPTTTVDLGDIFDVLLRTLPDYKVDPAASRLAQANTKARLRMLTIYHIANQLKYMVAGASNRSEIAVGYFTKYGDSGVDIMPLGNLVKEQIRELARFLDVPQAIIDKPPSAGLWEGQTDEDEMGFTYEALDRYLLTGEAPDEIRAKIEALIAASHHKRALPPIANF